MKDSNMAEVAPRAAGEFSPIPRSVSRNLRQQKLVQVQRQSSFRVQALVGRHGHHESQQSRSDIHNNNNNNSARSLRSIGSSSWKIPPRKHSSRRLLQLSMNGSSNFGFQNSGLSSSTGTNGGASFAVPDFSNSIRIDDLQDSASMLLDVGNNSFATHSHASGVGGINNNNHNTMMMSKWAQQSVKIRANHFVETNRCDSLEAHYHVGDLLGEGGFGEVYACRHIESGEPRAVKVIAKHERPEENQKVITEFNIVKNLDHPNILKLYALYESDTHFFLVTDLYAGGELYDELEQFGRFNEDDAALLMNNVLSCLNHCHKQNLAHRDLKPENILLEANKNFEDLKIIDFGLAAFGDRFTELEGSTYYMSPQVIEGNYNCKCDIWSCGVIAYVCLSGFAPFDGEEEKDVVQSILCGRVDFEDPIWDDISEDAMDFISYLLSYEEENRPTAEEALQHPWLQQIRQRRDGHCPRRRESTRNSLGNLQNFRANSKLKQCVCSLIASQFLKKREKEEIDTVFRSLDHDCDGKLTRADVVASYQQFFGQQLAEHDLDSMFEQVNFSGSGAIEYSEFVVASLFEKNLIDDFKLMAAFKIFDKENKGFISVDDLKNVLALDDDMEGYVRNVIVRQVDLDGDGRISFEDFKDMMFSNSVIPTSKPSARRTTPFRSKSAGHGSSSTGIATHGSLRSKRGARSVCSTLSGQSADSFSMNSGLTIAENLFEDDSAYIYSTRKEPGSLLDSAASDMAVDDMSFSNASFRHVFAMFDDKLKR